MPFASVFSAFPTLEVPFASVPSVFRNLRCSVGLCRWGGGVWGIVPSLDFVGKTSFAWAEGGWGDSSVVELRWKDFIRLGRGAWRGGGIVPSLNFVGKTSFALSFVFPCLRIYSPSTFTDTYRHIHISTRDAYGGGGSVWAGGVWSGITPSLKDFHVH